ncbi:hypothetical protein K227x_37110 [Rubripirellula lacrimiformis]|uniref:DUF2306 domain-containing protein n=1 Tax=Rubripirellula lacrimiformis TaxID=1930273 RepID=A0A517NDV8_9BACT|nr:DUF2306 domain-containing protein [Rubripirellula lacrimiformis]QDT05311.1 hypothetical protein K227x_37110 [Rubripirellula lacrimiformis]
MKAFDLPVCRSQVRMALKFAIALLLLKVLGFLLAEYRFYFPADFQSAFLSGSEHYFVGWYPVAFYTHIIVSPIALLSATWLMFSGNRPSDRSAHRRVAKVHVVILVTLLAPTGIAMSIHAHAGPIAGAGFAALAIATAGTAVMAAVAASRSRMPDHRRWATRCYLLLLSPLILRFAAGLAAVTQFESEGFYQFNAWFSWIVPLVGYQLYLNSIRHCPSLPPIAVSSITPCPTSTRRGASVHERALS